jgi:seryl-tRNA synthetase
MRKRLLRLAIVAIGFVIHGSALAESDTRTVQAEFDRCTAVMERVERSLRRYEDAIGTIKRTPTSTSSGRSESLSQEIASLENRLEYFRNRFERARGQADKIRDDLKNISGPTCPSCVESSVNLFCRSGENLQTDLDEYLGKVSDLRARMGLKDEKTITRAAKGFKDHRVSADSLYRALSDACSDKAATTLLEQARLNLNKADSLHKIGDSDATLTSLGIAQSLLDKAVKRCGGDK